MFDEEESKRLRIFQREKRQELQLIIERCNEVNFEYVCLPSIRSDKDLCFGSKSKRKIYLFADDKAVNSYMRKFFKEHFPEKAPEPKKTEDEPKEEVVEVRPSHPFASKTPRFLDIAIDSSGVYRRKRKTREAPVVVKKIYSAFGSSNKRNFLITKKPVQSTTPGVGVYNLNKPAKITCNHSFGGAIALKPAFDIVCAPINLDDQCEACEAEPKNIYWKNKKTLAILCRPCYNRKLFEIQTKTRGVVERLRKLTMMQEDFERKRYCGFYHQHNNTTAAVRLLESKDFHKRINRENFLNTLLKY